jgi:hypothetical protein
MESVVRLPGHIHALQHLQVSLRLPRRLYLLDYRDKCFRLCFNVLALGYFHRMTWELKDVGGEPLQGVGFLVDCF